MGIMGYQAATVERVLKGEKGVAGPPGQRGFKGEAGIVAAEQRNWKQCAWQKGDGRDVGLIKVRGRQLLISLFRVSFIRPTCN